MRILNIFKRNKTTRNEEQQIEKQESGEEYPPTESLNDFFSYYLKKFSDTQDLKKQSLFLGNRKALLIYIETLIDNDKLYEKLSDMSLIEIESRQSKNLMYALRSLDSINESFNALLEGKCLLFIEEDENLYEFEIKKTHDRSIEEPMNEKVVRGDHEGFIENLNTNINLIRNRIKNKNLVVRYYTLGSEAQTKIAIVFHNKIVNEHILKEVERRITSIDTDLIINPGFTEEFIEDNAYSLFPQMLNTERVDRAVANIMEGRIALLSDGAPDAIILPINFFAFFQSPDEYNSRWITGSFFRVLRMISLLIAVTLPSIYISIISFHSEIIPTELVLAIKSSVEEIPYPPLIEALLVELTIEIIREAGIRLPTPIGQTIGIVGGLVIGDAIVRAGLVSNVMIIVVALTAVSSFVVPSYDMSNTIRLLRFPAMFFAATLGFYGMVIYFTLVLIHLCKLESFGTPYLSPISPLRLQDLKDSFFRAPLWMMKKRPKDSGARKTTRQGDSREWKRK
ncbi:spore germination protein [Evansella clarkii]|uniref:spore germination protein n=1 Tax=Evansella clarkii TaxID=79879 RepID=UPI000997639A|nr:spore germination protein [Evansella clarkii]